MPKKINTVFGINISRAHKKEFFLIAKSLQNIEIDMEFIFVSKDPYYIKINDFWKENQSIPAHIDTRGTDYLLRVDLHSYFQ